MTDSDDSDMDDSERMPLMVDRRRRRKLIHWIPEFSAGTVGLIITIVGALVTSEVRNGQRDERIAALQVAREQDRLRTDTTLQDIRTEIRETRNAVGSTKEDVAAVKAQLSVMQANPKRQ